MANSCQYRMKICGPVDKVKNLCLLMDGADEAEGSIYGRIYSACVYEEGGSNLSHFAEIEGDCAWSVASSMLSGSIAEPNVESYIRENRLTVEIFSNELGFEFEEHYVFIDGEQVVADVVDYCEYDAQECDNERIAEILQRHNITDRELSKCLDDEYYRVGGFGSWEFRI